MYKLVQFLEVVYEELDHVFYGKLDVSQDSDFLRYFLHSI